MSYAQTLIDKALRITGGSRYQLSEMMHIDESFLAKLYNGKKPLPPLLAARLANFIGEDEGKAALIALALTEKDAQEREQFADWFHLSSAELPPEPIRNGVTVQLACSFRTTKQRITRLFKRTSTNGVPKLPSFFGTV